MDAASANDSRTPHRGLVVLIVDDDEQIRRLLLRLLSGRCRCLEAADGRDAYVVALREIPDIVLTDYEMPSIKGTELCRRIKSSPELSRTKVFLMSGTLADHNILPEESGEYSGFLKKPFDPEQLFEMLGFDACEPLRRSAGRSHAAPRLE